MQRFARIYLGLLVVALLAARAPVAAKAAEGYFTRGVVTLHKYPSSTSETVTQAFLGEPLRVVARKGAWLKVALPDQFGYEGWVGASEIRLGVTPQGTPVEVRAARSAVRAAPDGKVLLAVYLSTVLWAEDPNAEWIAVTLPDGRKGVVPGKDVRPIEGRPAPTAQEVLKVARLYMGVPYVWGGMSTAGVDCSGFTHTVYRFCGIKLHRDADQQFAGDGVAVDRKNLQPGDLVFFYTYLPDVVSHVGFYIGNGQVLHASSKQRGVNVGRLSDPYLSSRYAGARRILRTISTSEGAP